MDYFSSSGRRYNRFMDDSAYRSGPSSPTCTDDFISPRSLREVSAPMIDDFLPLDRNGRYIDDRMGEIRRPSFPRGENYSLQSSRRNLDYAHADRGGRQLSQRTDLYPRSWMAGSYANDFNTPRTLDDYLQMSDSQLEQMMASYNLIPSMPRYRSRPGGDLTDRYGQRGSSLGSSRASRLANLTILFEALGARQLADQVRYLEGGTPFGMLIRDRSMESNDHTQYRI